MQIVININAEAIIEDEIRKYVRENLHINFKGILNKVIQEQVASVNTSEISSEAPIASSIDNMNIITPNYEYAPRKDKRRNKIEVAYHEAELRLKRTLTIEEKSQIAANIELAEKSIEQKKEDMKLRSQAEELTKELIQKVKATTNDSPVVRDLFDAVPSDVSNISTGTDNNTAKEVPTTEDTPWSLPASVPVETTEVPLNKEATSTTDPMPKPQESSLFSCVPSADDGVIPKTDPLTDINSLFK